MKQLLLMVSVLLAMTGSAVAQSNPNWTLGFVPSPSQWNTEWSTKTDTSGGTLTGGTISGGTMSGTIAGSPTFSGTPVFSGASITGGTQTGATVSGNSATATNGATHTLAGWLAGWNVIVPTNSAADVTTIQNAVNGTQPVFMAAGTWQVCSQITVPVNQHIKGVYSQSNPGSNGPSQSNAKSVVTCPTNGTFSAGQAYFALKDHDVIEGLDFYCQGASPPYNGVNALNAVSVDIGFIAVYACKNGVSRFSDGNVPGASEPFSQLARIHDSTFYENTGYGYFADLVNGGFVSDDIIGPNNDFVLASGSTGGAYMNFTAAMQFQNNRCEVGGAGEPCLDIENSGQIVVSGNAFEQTQALKLNNANSVTVTGNYGSSATFGALLNVEFSGANTNIQFAGNTWTGTAIIYKVDAGGTFDSFSSFAEYANAPTTIYNDAYTQSVMQPLAMANAGTVSNNAALAAVNTVLSPTVGNHISSRGFPPTVSSCGTGSPSVTGDDSFGTVTTGTGGPTACTLTFGVPYTVAPQCTANTSTSAVAEFASAPTTTAFTVTFSAALTSGKVYYSCAEQIASLLPGGVGLTSVWAANQVTLTTAAGTSPSGASDAASLVEDSTAGALHDTNQIASKSSGTYTMSAYIKAATGTDNIDLLVIDSGLGNSIGCVFNPTTGAFIGNASNVGRGAAVQIATGSQSVGSGWWRVWMTFSGFAPNYEQINLARGTTIIFNGNGTNNVLVWGPAMRAGTLP